MNIDVKQSELNTFKMLVFNILLPIINNVVIRTLVYI